MERQKAILTNWYVAYGRLYGEVVEHPNFEPGDEISTTQISKMGYGWAQTLNTDYELREIHSQAPSYQIDDNSECPWKIESK